MSTKNNSKRPKAAEFTLIYETPEKITYGTAVIPFDEHQGCWMLPAGMNQGDRRIWSANKALAYAKVIDSIISEWFRHIRTTQRGGS